MLYPALAVAAGLVLLVWSANRFVDGAAALARHFKVPPLIIGIVIIGFGTSAPEMLVSAISSYEGNPGIALGNAFGSNITNIALILGVSALIHPLNVPRAAIVRELPLLGLATLTAVLLLWNGAVSRLDAALMLGVFAAIMAYSIRATLRERKAGAALAEGEDDGDGAEAAGTASPAAAWFWLAVGLGMMLVSSRLLVWGAVAIAETLGVSDLIIGLTVVAIGTSLPELASSIVAARRGEHDLAIGNIIGSNTFNTLVVVGIAGLIRPLATDPEIMTRDIPVVAFLTVLLYLFCRGWRGPGRLTRAEGGFFLLCYAAYTAYLVFSAMPGTAAAP